MAISEMAISFLIRCKGTTKNAHTQAKRAFFLKNASDAVVWAAFCVKECDGTHSECCARRVPTLRNQHNT